MRYIYLVLHLLGGSVLLWQSYKITIPALAGLGFVTQAFAEGFYLALTVVWGNVGWDHYKLLTQTSALRELNDSLYKTTLLPILVLVLVVGVVSLIPGICVNPCGTIPLVLGILVYFVFGLVLYVTYRGHRETEEARKPH